MAKLTFSEDNVRTIERLSKKYDPETHPALKDHTDTMPADDWVFMCDYMRRRTRETIITCLCARAYLDSLIERGMLGSKGLEEFFHGSVHAAQSNFGCLEGPEEFALEDRHVDILMASPRQILYGPLRSASYPLRRSLSKGNGGS
ncbi:MAG: hypothetical protein M3346_00580 [Actinomycetota bacterium]|nr:hypothetical protein [Actinomycetota bacterium]